MIMAEKYGFYTEEYDGLSSLETLMTGDGKTLFSPLTYASDKKTAIGFGYGHGEGIGVLVHNPESYSHEHFDIRWQVKFDNVATIDSLISTLQRVREAQLALSDFNPISTGD